MKVIMSMGRIVLIAVVVAFAGLVVWNEIIRNHHQKSMERLVIERLVNVKIENGFEIIPMEDVTGLKPKDNPKFMDVDWIHVEATREGLVGKITASGLKIKPKSIFAALPHRNALGKTIVVRYGSKSIQCKIEDVGPWSTKDDYWKDGNRPLSESGKRVPDFYMEKYGKPKNESGIDLSDGLWDALGIKRGIGVTKVSWRFI